jgi:DNA-binding PadR family transcriptional regulator
MRTVRAADSRLGFALLALLHRAPQSGYDLRKTFASTPLGLFSDSPGAIYPALRRLRRKGWIRAAAEEGPRSRGRQAFGLTSLGRRALVTWLETPPTAAEVERDMDGLALRLAFTSQVLPPAAVARFLKAWRRAVEAHVENLETFLAAQGGILTLSGRLAFESGLEGLRAHTRWAAGALRRLQRARTNHGRR